jgi:hypothetical protein
MRKRVCKVLGFVLGGIILSGCGEQSNIPASKGGVEARNAIEYPLGPPPASSKKVRKSAKAAPAPANPAPEGAH